jgi:hypothetical protein
LSLGTAAGALAQLIAVAAIGWVAGDLLLRRSLDPAAPLPAGVGLPERALAAVAGFVGFSVVVMVGHLVTGGALFGLPGLVPVAGVAVAMVGVSRRAWPRRVPLKIVVPAVLVLAAVFVVPVIAGGSGVRTGDAPWHLGWTEQLLAGEPVPVGPAPEHARNAYPWGFHAVLATMVRLVPGTDPLVALEATHVLLVLALPLGAACVARRVHARAGWAAAAMASLVGGWGWLKLSEPDFVFHPDNARYGADLVVASPNSVYALFPPAQPRELGLVLLAAAGVLIAIAVQAADRKLMIVAGVITGVVGLVSVPLFLSAVVWVLIASALAPRDVRLRTAGTLLGVAACVFSLWAMPLVRDVVEFGGLLNTTPQLGIERPLISALGSWGLMLFGAIAGLVVVARTKNAGARTVFAFAVGAIVVLVLAFARAEFDWGLAGNASLLHQGRAWPPAHLIAAALAGVAVVAAYDALRPRVRRLAAVAGAAVLGVGAISPVMASIRFTDVLSRDGIGYVYAANDLAASSFVRRAASHLGPDDVVRVDGSDELAWFLFQFSGVRLADYDDPRLQHNDLRIRFRNLAAAWDDRMSTGGFEADYVVVEADDTDPGADVIETGEYAGARYSFVDVSQ